MWGTIKEGYVGVFRNRFNLFAIICVILISMLFGLLCVSAFWSPDDKLKDFPVAIINLDKGEHGDDIIENLKENDQVKWEFYNENIFKDGIENTDYSFGFLIPENFSQQVQSAQNGTPQQAEIIYYSNMRKNFMLSQLSRNVKNVLTETVSSNITHEYVAETFDTLYDIKDGLAEAADGADALYEGAEKLSDGATTLSTNMNTLGNSVLQSGVAYQTAMNQILATYAGIIGNTSLTDTEKVAYLGALYTNLNGAYTQYKTTEDKIDTGISGLMTGVADLIAGTNDLASGTDELQTALTDNATNMEESLVNSSEDMGVFISEPVDVSSSIYGEVKNYGSGFAPMFISIGLWIGALILFFIIGVRPADSTKLSRPKIVFGRFIVYATFGIIEAIAITGGALLLGVEVTSIPVFMLFACLISLVFIGIIQLIHLVFGDLVSKGISVILVILQVAAAGGTFPVDLTKPFFIMIHPFLPFSYTIDGFREIISGGNWQSLSTTVAILITILLAVLAISLLCSKRQTKTPLLEESKNVF